MFDSHPSGRTPAEWSFGWLWDQKEVTCVLSGMNSMEMVREKLTEEQRRFVDDVVGYMSHDMSELGNAASMQLPGIWN